MDLSPPRGWAFTPPQSSLNVTGNNIANINTKGYTRQRIDQVSFKAGAYDRYRSQLDNHVGSGALVMNINQIRDPYLDVRYRNTNADVGYSDRMLAGLQEIADILDEIGLGENPSDNERGRRPAPRPDSGPGRQAARLSEGAQQGE